MSSRRSLRSRPMRADPVNVASNASTRSTRFSDSVATSDPVTLSRSTSDSSEDPKRSFRLTLRMPSNKLREVSGRGKADLAAVGKRNIFTENPIITGPRNSRSKKKIVEVDTSDDEDDIEDQEEDELDEDEMDVDGDADVDDAPPRQPVSKRNTKASAPSGKAAKSVEMKEMDVAEEEDEELSELESDAGRDAEEQEESGAANGVADDDGLEEEDEEDEEDEDEDEDVDTDQATPASRTSTPDFNRLTKRQRGSLGNDFLQLPMEPQVKKHLTAEERAMRRAEMARRRKNLSEKRNEEEKMDTINRLLRKQAPKRRGRMSAVEAPDAIPGEQEQPEIEKPDPTMIRWISDRDGCKVGVPQEWLGTSAGRMFGSNTSGDNQTRKLVEEV
ncbi:hypothetical protein MPDQ_006954 [Monascus purpureus]|uniref:INO80 complex subunit B-like conserved region domain-containing protein n=1 Tax=Monascus purpureus TaxID=5098 RepID=A0A507QT86_MONPU|nr:hypothetical protein MPDQ_006954 [Monascus purpureus]BDD60922.1 hypothetical protein MAP00_006010 [Monascus purpureus]